MAARSFQQSTEDFRNGGFPDGVPGSGIGGGIYNNSNGVFTSINITIASNSAIRGIGYNFQGTGAGANVANTNGSLTVKNSLLAYGGTNGNAWGVITDGGFNISSDGSANFSSGSSFNFTDPRLGPLANYGGPTLTMALRPTSPAIDLGTSAGAPPVDQRNFSRPFGLGVDVGAYEFHSNQTELPRLDISLVANNVLLNFQALADTEYRLQVSSTLSNWVVAEIIGPFSNSTNVSRSTSTSGQSNQFFRLAIP